MDAPPDSPINMRTHAYKNTTERALSLCGGSLRILPGAIVHIPDTSIEHPDVLHAKRTRILVPYTPPAPLAVLEPEPVLEPVPEPEPVPESEPEPEPPAELAPELPITINSIRRKRGRGADAKDTYNAN